MQYSKDELYFRIKKTKWNEKLILVLFVFLSCLFIKFTRDIRSTVCDLFYIYIVYFH